MSIGTTFAVIWLAFTAATALAIVPIVVWAIKTRQFSDSEHARYLPLRSSCPRGADRGAGEDKNDVLS